MSLGPKLPLSLLGCTCHPGEAMTSAYRKQNTAFLIKDIYVRSFFSQNWFADKRFSVISSFFKSKYLTLNVLHLRVSRVCCCFNYVRCFFVCLTIYMRCQIQLRHKQAFRCVFERASPCLVSFPSPGSNKGPSIRGQAAVSASLQYRQALMPGQAGGRATPTVVLDTKHCHPTSSTPV